ncbi:PREDICTED: uncharacterized protein LOC109582583 [Amphimedon queenslandica]|uniref:Uncharacterized protein n=2 Tax=Amphimedon queenslandica TaxID=400682 RepID=A0AAN0J7B0_AMPQE|nr:PREDICTED: uncharacterized protein LOC109582583 [Amphimedon queenslandica]|eukprot:XP_019852905.1 PREDICTED: uncharacterized protein LOC109582583 [Amphimedon queenslandica]
MYLVNALKNPSDNILVYGRTANIAGKILQIILLSVSIVFLLISGISVAVGWAKTCKTIKDATDGLVTCNDDDGSRYLNQEMFGSAICAWVSLSFTAVAIQFAVVKSIMEEKGETHTEEEEPLINSSH